MCTLRKLLTTLIITACLCIPITSYSLDLGFLFNETGGVTEYYAHKLVLPVGSTSLTGSILTLTLQGADADLTAIAALAGTTGYLWKSAANTYALRTTLAELETDLGAIDIIDSTEVAAYQPLVTAGSLTDEVVLVADLGKAAKWFREAQATTGASDTIEATGGFDDYHVYNILVTSDTDNQALTLDEDPVPANQTILIITNVAANTLTVADSAAVQELSSPATIEQDESIIFIYDTDRWREICRATKNMTFASIGETVKLADADGTGSVQFAFATSTDRVITVPGDADQTIATLSASNTWTGVNDFGGATSLEIPNSDDPDADAVGEISFDTDGWFRVYNGTIQYGVARTQEEIHITVIKPNDLADAQRDAFLVWSNESGMTFTVTGWKGWSDVDNTTLNIETTDGTGATNATVDAVELATNGTGCYYGSDTTITAPTIANGSLIWLDFDDTDAPGIVKLTIYGYYNGDVN